MRVQSARILATAAAALLVAQGTGCCGGGYHGGSPSDAATYDPSDVGADSSRPKTITGQIIFRGLGEGTAYRLEYYRHPIANPAPRTYGDGHCDIRQLAGEGDDLWGPFFQNPGTGDYDLGATVTAKANDGSMSLIAPRESESLFNYEASVAGPPFAFGKSFTLTNSGNTAVQGWPAGELATLTVPGQVFPIPSSVDTMSGPVTVTYSGGERAMFFHVRIQTSNGNVDCYPGPDTTSFQLPPDVMAILPRFVTPLVSAERIQYVTTNAGAVLVRVSSDNLD
jgi:hypothetical protein